MVNNLVLLVKACERYSLDIHRFNNSIENSSLTSCFLWDTQWIISLPEKSCSFIQLFEVSVCQNIRVVVIKWLVIRVSMLTITVRNLQHQVHYVYIQLYLFIYIYIYISTCTIVSRVQEALNSNCPMLQCQVRYQQKLIITKLGNKKIK